MNYIFSLESIVMSICLFVLDCVSVWSTVVFIARPQEELQLACAGDMMVGAAAFIVNREGFCV